MHEDGYVARRGRSGVCIDDIVDVGPRGRGEEGVGVARERLAVKTPVSVLSYEESVAWSRVLFEYIVPASSSFFSSSVSWGWKTPLLHATVSQVEARLKRPKPSLNSDQAQLASLLPGCFVVRAGEGGIVGDCCHGLHEEFEMVRVAVWGVKTR